MIYFDDIFLYVYFINYIIIYISVKPYLPFSAICHHCACAASSVRVRAARHSAVVPVRLLCHSQFNNDNNGRILSFSCLVWWAHRRRQQRHNDLVERLAPLAPNSDWKGEASCHRLGCGIKTIISLCNKVNCVRNAWRCCLLFIYFLVRYFLLLWHKLAKRI